MTDLKSLVTMNRGLLLAADEIHCGHCLEAMVFDDITDWIDDYQTAICPHCNVDAVMGAPIEMAQDYKDEAFGESDAIKDLESFFAQPPVAVIGEGRHRATDVVEYVDQEEQKYNKKYGLDKNGDPLPVDEILGDRLDGDSYSYALEEGFEMLDEDGDDPQSGLSKFNEPSGFNQW
jgi:hypothetical protein